MNRTARAATAAALLLRLGSAGLSAQTHVVLGVGGGVLFPTKSSFGSDVKSVGYHLQGMVGIVPGAGRINIRFDGQYGSVNYEKVGAETPKDKILTVNGDLVFHPSVGGSVRPYLLAGPSYGHFSFRTGTGLNDETTNNFGFNGGAGLGFGNSSKLWFFIESRYIYTKDHKYIPVTVGIRINTAQAYGK